jgi:hypothetical protein
MSPQFFLAAAALAIAILIPLGAPVPAIAVGIALAGFLVATKQKYNEPSSARMKKKASR